MKRMSIVVGVLMQGDKILISQRQKHQAYADYWEFPGGKVEAGEQLEAALSREFTEEIGVETQNWQPLITIPWDYEHAQVELNVFCCDDFSGEAHGAEGQQIKWISMAELDHFKFPEANQGIVTALRLPKEYMISGNFYDQQDGLQRLEAALEEGIRFVQLRAKRMDEADFIAFAKPAIDLVHQFNGTVLINGKPEWLQQLPEADGLQLASSAIMEFVDRPISENKILSVSTHTEAEIAKAIELNADVILLSPVKETSSHPGLPGIGWKKFAELSKNIPVPVYALGGMKAEDIEEAIQNGAQGVAAISSFWPQPI